MKWDYLVMSVICFGMSWFCYWYNNNVVAPNSAKDVLEICMYALALFSGIALYFGLRGRYNK